MISYQNCALYASVIIYLGIKILCSFVVWFRGMYKQPTLTSIPERNEVEEEHKANKWVPKKKHEVLKAKYKCLKKLFQIYDASVIGILPETYNPDGYHEEDIQTKKKRKRRSHRTKTDACAGTTEVSSGDMIHMIQDSEKESVASAVFEDLKATHCSCTSTQIESACSKENKYAASADSKDNLTVQCGCTQTSDPLPSHPIPYLMISEKRKLTRFQIFVQRILGIRQERSLKKNYVLPNGHIYAASDNMINSNMYEKRRRRGLRFRRIRRPKKIQSETALRSVKSPVILTYVQSVQKSCLMDTTPRHCPIVGCEMISYGIINYNDHLNLCHFTDRKFFCHYCHEGFQREYDKIVHENQHLGINKLNSDQQQNLSVPKTPQSFQKTTITQTDPETKCDVSEDKLKKIVSFFDKISNPDQMLTELKKNRCSESNLQQSKTDSETADDSIDDSDKRSTVSCMNLHREVDDKPSIQSEGSSRQHTCCSPVVCHFCGENFNFRRQLSLHVDLEHKFHNKFSKFHSCAGIIQHPTKMRSMNKMDLVSEDGKIQVQTVDRSHGVRRVSTASTISQSSFANTRRKSEESLSYDPSTNIVYYTSLETVKKPSVMDNIVQKVKKLNSYKWEPGTKIIRV